MEPLTRKQLKLQLDFLRSITVASFWTPWHGDIPYTNEELLDMGDFTIQMGHVPEALAILQKYGYESLSDRSFISFHNDSWEDRYGTSFVAPTEKFIPHIVTAPKRSKCSSILKNALAWDIQLINENRTPEDAKRDYQRALNFLRWACESMQEGSELMTARAEYNRLTHEIAAATKARNELIKKKCVKFTNKLEIEME